MAWGARIARLITDSTSRLQVAAHAIGQGDFTTRVEVPSRDEFGELAAAFNTMTAGLAAGREAMRERDRLQHELELARRIQTRLLPANPPIFAALEVAATNAMSEQVGGDYYDFVPLSDGRIGIAIADVSGHGVGAALLMSSVKAALVSSAAVDNSPCGITERVNRLLESSMEPGKFVTFFFAALDPVSLRMEYVNAGHPAPLLLRRDGAIEKLEAGGFILGILSDATYEQGAVTLAPGDTLALFTDGVTEAEAPDKSLYDESRVESLLRREQGRSAAAVLERLVDDIRVFEDGIAACDDLTAIVLRVA
jgi:sigma-B regulation protein RsbU (phosphoserine phosphatase)